MVIPRHYFFVIRTQEQEKKQAKLKKMTKLMANANTLLGSSDAQGGCAEMTKRGSDSVVEIIRGDKKADREAPMDQEQPAEQPAVMYQASRAIRGDDEGTGEAGGGGGD